MRKWHTIAVFVFLWRSAAAQVGLECEQRAEPLGIDVVLPRLSWQLNSGTQTAYEVLVASSPALL